MHHFPGARGQCRAHAGGSAPAGIALPRWSQQGLGGHPPQTRTRARTASHVTPMSLPKPRKAGGQGTPCGRCRPHPSTQAWRRRAGRPCPGAPHAGHPAGSALHACGIFPFWLRATPGPGGCCFAHCPAGAASLGVPLATPQVRVYPAKASALPAVSRDTTQQG